MPELPTAPRKLYTVSLSGKDRVLHYSQLHGVAIQKRTGKSPRQLCEQWDDHEARIVLLVAGLAPVTKGGRWQVASLMRWIDEHFDEVAGWLDDEIQAGRGLGPLFTTVLHAAFASGMVLGVSVDVEAITKEPAEGKEEAPAESSAT